MKITKEQVSNGIWILAIVLILFSPIGFHLKVLVGKIFSGSADTIEVGQQKTLTNYNWMLQEVTGDSVNFQSFEGKVVLVNFWATWCPPCVAEMPSLERLHNDYKDRVVFAFVTNDNPDKVVNFIEKKGYKFPVYFETSKTPDLLISTSIPATYILSKSGKIVVKEIGAAKWDSQSTRDMLDELLSE